MGSTFVLLGEWTIREWRPDPTDASSPDGIPSHGVKPGSLLHISQSAPNFFSLSWANQSDKSCSVSDLQSDEAQTFLRGRNLPVIFGDKSVPCDLTIIVIPDLDILTCRMDQAGWCVRGQSFPETGGGTFIATANAGGSGAARKR
jgi:hypothetical protein